MNPKPAKKRTVCVHLDAHVHVYPSYDLTAFLEAALDHMPRCSPTDQHVLCLAERRDCAFFQFLAQDEISLPSDRFCITAWDPDGAVKIRHLPTNRDLWLVAGRQYAAAERVEVCALFSDLAIPDGRPLLDIIAEIRDAGALAALPWGFGKWFFSRGRLVQKALDAFPPSELFLVDTLMRPACFPDSAPFRRAAREHRPVLCGTDPLSSHPASEARLPGLYRSVFSMPFPEDPTRIVPALRSFLTAPTAPILPAGDRQSLLTALLRR